MLDWQTELDQTVDHYFETMVAVRRRLHMHPELSGQEHQTSLYLYQLLGDQGLDVQMGPEGRGLVAQSHHEAAPRVALRADIDALRIADQKQVPYRSQRPGLMHACGHDGHTAVVVGAALALERMRAEAKLPWPVPWRAIFQPSEETATGAQEMIAAGALEGIEAIFAAHVDPTREVGHLGLRPGILTAGCDAMRLTIYGQGGHAARPHEARDPIAAAAQLISTLYLFVPRANDSQDAVVVTIGQILGGENPNVIPERVELRGTLRTLDRQVRQRTVEHIQQLARGIGETSGTRIEVAFDGGMPGVENNAQLVQLLHQAGASVVGEENLDRVQRPSMGSEDFAAYLEHVPGAMFRLGCASPRVGNAGLHTPTFDLDEQALAIGAKVLAKAAVLWAALHHSVPTRS